MRGSGREDDCDKGNGKREKEERGEGKRKLFYDGMSMSE